MFKIKKTIEYGLYLLVFLLPLQTRWIIKAGELNGGYWEYGTISCYATDVILLILLLLFIWRYFFKKRTINLPADKQGGEPQIKIYWWYIAGLELMVFVSIFFAFDKQLAFYGYVRFLMAIGLFWLVAEADYKKSSLIYYFLGGCLAQAILGIWQFAAQHSFASKWLGMSAHLPAELGTSVVETMAGERWLRAYGGLDHPNVLGGLLAVGLLVTVWLIANRQLSANNFRNTKLYAHWLSAFLFLAVLFFALFFTFSRGAGIGLSIGIISLLITSIIKKDLLAQRKILTMIFTFSIIAFFLFNRYQDLALTRLSPDARLEKKSNIERLESYQTAKPIISKHWLAGCGIGNYTLAVQQEMNKSEPSYFYQPVHNAFLLVFSEIGIVGLLFFLGLLVYALAINQLSKNFSSAVILPIVIMMLVDHWWWSLHFGLLLFWLLLGLAVREQEERKI